MVANVLEMVPRRIEQALAQRDRYKYVKPRVLREGMGWCIVSPNCSRRVDPDGGEIAIAWLAPAGPGHWNVYARDDDHETWERRAVDLSLDEAMSLVCADPHREFWR